MSAPELRGCALIEYPASQDEVKFSSIILPRSVGSIRPCCFALLERSETKREGLIEEEYNMKKKAFTLVEILVAVIILAFLSSLSLATFQKTAEANKDRVCQQNLS